MYYILHHHHLFWKSLFLLCSARVGHLPKKMSLHIFLNIAYSGCRLSNCMSTFMHSIPPKYSCSCPYTAFLPPPISTGRHFFICILTLHIHIQSYMHYHHFECNLHLKSPEVHQQLHVIRNTAHRPSTHASPCQMSKPLDLLYLTTSVTCWKPKNTPHMHFTIIRSLCSSISTLLTRQQRPYSLTSVHSK